MPIRLTDSTICRLNNLLCAGLLTSCLIATPCAAWEFDLTPDTTQYLADPSFIPMAGQIFSETTYGHNTIDEDNRQPNGVIGVHYSSNANLYSQELAYGITDWLWVHASGEYVTRNASEQFPEGFSNSSSFSGFTNPTFGVNARVLTQRASHVSVDVALNYTPPVADNYGQSGSVSVSVNREMRSLTLQAEAAVTYNDSYTATNFGSTRTNGSDWTYSLAFRSEWRFLNRWAINSGVVYSQQSDETNSFPGTNNSYSNSYGGTVSPYAALAFDVWPNHANIAFEYDHYFLGDDKQSGTFVSGTWVNQAEDLYAVHLRLLF
jgi:hypothetical protein